MQYFAHVMDQLQLFKGYINFNVFLVILQRLFVTFEKKWNCLTCFK